MKYIITYLICINIITFFVYYLDKQKAKKNAYRISERNLIGLTLIGGCLGAIVSMNLFRHKTKHLKFTLGIPLILALQIISVIYLITIL